MNIKQLIGGVLLTFFLLNGSVQAGIVVGGTRLIYDGSKREASLSVKNPDSIPYLIQAWADADGVAGKNKGAAKPPFMITPPLFRLDGGSENMVRIIRTGGDLPEDKESVYWLNVKSIPSSSRSEENVLQITIKTRIKLFYRPAGLKGLTEDDYKSVTFNRVGNKLHVTNPTPYYLTFYSLKMGSTVLDTTNIMVPPKGGADYKLSASATGNQVSWQLINDYGGDSKPVTTSLH